MNQVDTLTTSRWRKSRPDGFSAMLTAHKQFEAAVSKEWQAWLIKTMYWVFPKTGEIAETVVRFVAADQIPERIAKPLSATPFITTAVFAACCLILASWVFHRKEF